MTRILADESVDMALVRALRERGHEVVAVSETNPGATDDFVCTLARDHDSVLLTEDRDFGRLLYSELGGVAGVLYLRYPAPARARMESDVLRVLAEEDAVGAFAVIQPGRRRIRRTTDR